MAFLRMFALLFPCLLIFVSQTAHAADEGTPKHDRHAAAGVTSLDVYADGDRIHLLIATREDGNPPRLQYLRSDDGGGSWSTPVTVGAAQSPPEPAHRGMDAQIAAAGNRIVVVWTTRGSEDRFGRGPMESAFSEDGGKTWKAGKNPADDGTSSGHAFLDLAADGQGAFHLVWLDNRGSESGKGLRYARSADGGASWSANLTVDPATCECCWNTIATAPGGKTYILYRDRDPRDMAIVASEDGGRTWGKPVTVGRFGWDINGCPHVGGGLAIAPGSNGTVLRAVVWTAKGEAARGDYVLSSADGGFTWSDPAKLGDAKSWHPDIACDDKTVAAVWDEYTDSGTAVFASTSRDAGKTWEAPVRLNAQATAADHPRILATRGGFRVFWTEKSADNPVKWVSRTVQ